MKSYWRRIRGKLLRAERKKAVDSACRYERNQGTLLIDCTSCPGDRELSSPSCLNAVSRVLSRESGVTEIVLSGEWETSYGEATLDILKSIAEVVRFIRHARIRRKRFDKCDQCPASPEEIFSEILGSFPEIEMPENVHSYHVPSEGTRFACRECLDSIVENIAHIDRMMRSVRKEIANGSDTVESG